MAQTVPRAGARSRIPGTLLAGIALILGCEALLALDVALRGGAVVPYDPVPAPVGPLETVARIAAVNVTPLCWTGFLLAADGLLARTGAGSPVRRHPGRFAFAYLTSIPIWLLFDAVNFGLLDAWDYHGLPEEPARRLLGYFLAFGAISPAMFLAAEGFRRTRLGAVRGRPLRIGRRTETASMAVGAAFLVFPLVVQAPVGTVTLWLGLALLLDPLNRRLGMPSVFEDWSRGRYGRTLALMAGGLLCGLLWEFWNYWAVAKWTYDLPFLGPLEDVRYFEMPVLGLGGFPPFAIECWAAYQTALWIARRLGTTRLGTPRDDEIL